MNMYDVAKKYSDIGLSVLPIQSGNQKSPFDDKKSWGEYKTRRPTDKELKEWFGGKTEIQVGIGAICGKLSGIVVIDLDSYKKESSIVLETPVKVKSGGGGLHGYFTYSEDITNSVNDDLSVDVRAEGGFIVLPPTIHKSGKKYEWQVKGKLSELFKNLPELPKEIYEQIKRNSDNEPFNILDYVNVSEGSRNDSLYRAACSILSNYDTETAFQLVNEFNRTYSPPLKDFELQQLFGSAKTFIESQKTQVNPMAHGSDLRFVNLEPIPLSDLSTEQLRIDWLWEGYIAKGELTLCSALPKVGKSTLIAHLLKSFQTEQPLAGQLVIKSRVLVISEESKSIWARKREDMELEGDVWVIPQPFKEKPSYELWKKLVQDSARFCKDNSIDLVVIDTITSFWHVRDEGNAPEVQAALLPLINFTDTGAAVLIIHHHRKSGGDEGVASRGSTAFGSAVSIILEISRKEKENPNNSQRVLKTFSRFEESPSEIVIELVGDKYKTLGTPSQVSRQARLDRLLTILPEVPKGMTSKDLLDNWDIEELGKKPSKSSVIRYLNDLREGGQIKIVDEIIVKRSKTPLYGKIPSKQARNNETQITPLSYKDETRSDNVAKNEVKDDRIVRNTITGVLEKASLSE